MGLPALNFELIKWRTQHQPIVEVSVGDLATVDAAVAVAVTVVVAVDAAAVEVVVGAARRRASGFPSPSWDVSSRTRRSGPWKRSIFSLSLSKRPRLLTLSLAPSLRTRF